jgi:hypothetical protein
VYEFFYPGFPFNRANTSHAAKVLKRAKEVIDQILGKTQN